MRPFNEVFSEIYQLRLRVLLKISFTDNALRQRIMSEIYEQGKQIYERDPSSFSADTLADITREKISECISIPSGISPAVLMQGMSEEEQKATVLLYQENRNTEEIAAQLNVSKERAEAITASVKARIEEKLGSKEFGEGVSALGLIIGILKAYPVTAAPAAVPSAAVTPGISASVPKAIEAGGRGAASTAVSSPAAASSSISQAAAISGGKAVGSSAVYSASNAGPAAAGAAKTAAAGGLSGAKIAVTAAAAVTVIGGGGYAGYKYAEDRNKRPEPVPEVIEEPAEATPVPEEVIIDETETGIPAPEGPETDPAVGWLGEWTADSGEKLIIYDVSDTGISLTFHKYTESGNMIDSEYEMEFDDEDKTVVSEIGGPMDHGGWEYTFILEDGSITVKSRYPDQIFHKD